MSHLYFLQEQKKKCTKEIKNFLFLLNTGHLKIENLVFLTSTLAKTIRLLKNSPIKNTDKDASKLNELYYRCMAGYFTYTMDKRRNLIDTYFQTVDVCIGYLQNKKHQLEKRPNVSVVSILEKLIKNLQSALRTFPKNHAYQYIAVHLDSHNDKFLSIMDELLDADTDDNWYWLNMVAFEIFNKTYTQPITDFEQFNSEDQTFHQLATAITSKKVDWFNTAP